MKRFFHLISYLFSLGVFGLLLALNVAVLGWTIYNGVMLNLSIRNVNDSITLRQAYADLEYGLLDQSLFEKYYVLTGDEETVPQHVEIVQFYWGLMDWAAEVLGVNLEEIDDLDSASDIEIRFMQDLAAMEKDYEAGFAEVLAANQAGDAQEAIRLSDEITTPLIEDMHIIIQEAFSRATVYLEQDKQQHRIYLHREIFSGILSLMILPLLAIWAFLHSSQINQPLLSLSNALMAMKNGKYRKELLEDQMNQNNWSGKAARSLHRLAEKQQQREQVLMQEMNALQNRFNETRRRRLMVGALKRNAGHDETA